MKRILSLALVLCVLAVFPASMETDAFTSASVKDYYGDSALTGEALMNAVNGKTGFYLVSTTNPDGSPNAAYFVFGISELHGKYYVRLGLAENQSKQNLMNDKRGVAVYAATPGTGAEDKPYAVSGARIRFQVIEDEALINELKGDAENTPIFAEVLEVLPLG